MEKKRCKMIYQDTTNQNKTRVDILISNKIAFKTKTVTYMRESNAT